MNFVCPADKQPLVAAEDELICQSCGVHYPMVGGVPILINDANSVFAISDYNKPAKIGTYSAGPRKANRLRSAYHRLGRRLSETRMPGEHFFPLRRVLADNPTGKILVIGAGERNRYEGDITYTDVTIGYGTNLACVCDAHDIPFPDGTFDAVVANAVLEHVCDPQQCVAEITRVLKPHGIIAAVTPFLQPVHMGAYDFTRFTYLGHRRLFRYFDEIESGTAGGAGMTAVHLLREMMVAVSDNKRVQSAMRFFALLITYPMRYLDFLYKTESAYNAATAFYFLGRRRAAPIPDREILAMFRGRK